MSETRDLLLRWHDGDPAALAELVARDRDWIEAHVRRRLGPVLRRRDDTQDLVQNTLVEVLRSGPRFVVSDKRQLRGLLARMVENALLVAANHHHAHKRDVRREVPLAAPAGSESVLFLDRPATVTDPSHAAERSELRDWVRLALELIDADDRRVIVLRDFDDLPFAAIAERLGIAEDAARMRYRRALPRLAAVLERLQRGGIEELLA